MHHLHHARGVVCLIYYSEVTRKMVINLYIHLYACVCLCVVWSVCRTPLTSIFRLFSSSLNAVGVSVGTPSCGTRLSVSRGRLWYLGWRTVFWLPLFLSVSPLLHQSHGPVHFTASDVSEYLLCVFSLCLFLSFKDRFPSIFKLVADFRLWFSFSVFLEYSLWDIFFCFDFWDEWQQFSIV